MKNIVITKLLQISRPAEYVATVSNGLQSNGKYSIGRDITLGEVDLITEELIAMNASSKRLHIEWRIDEIIIIIMKICFIHYWLWDLTSVDYCIYGLMNELHTRNTYTITVGFCIPIYWYVLLVPLIYEYFMSKSSMQSCNLLLFIWCDRCHCTRGRWMIKIDFLFFCFYWCIL